MDNGQYNKEKIKKIIYANAKGYRIVSSTVELSQKDQTDYKNLIVGDSKFSSFIINQLNEDQIIWRCIYSQEFKEYLIIEYAVDNSKDFRDRHTHYHAGALITKSLDHSSKKINIYLSQALQKLMDLIGNEKIKYENKNDKKENIIECEKIYFEIKKGFQKSGDNRIYIHYEDQIDKTKARTHFITTLFIDHKLKNNFSEVLGFYKFDKKSIQPITQNFSLYKHDESIKGECLDNKTENAVNEHDEDYNENNQQTPIHIDHVSNVINVNLSNIVSIKRVDNLININIPDVNDILPKITDMVELLKKALTKYTGINFK